jgi:hypothetical protein
MIYYSFMGMLWTINTISGNNGDVFNMIWLRATQWSMHVPCITLGLAAWAALSYGSQADVM